MRFLQAVRKVAFVRRAHVILDFRKTELISTELAPLLAAEIARIKAMRDGNAVTGYSPNDAEARRRLQALGLFKALGIHEVASTEEVEKANEQFEIKTGIALDGEVPDELAEEFSIALGLSVDQRRLIEKAFKEALENISEHAYYDKARIAWPAEQGRWWICCVTSIERKGAFMLACDLGMTIPATIKETAAKRGPSNVAELARYVAANIGRTEDEKLLGAAFQDGVTRRADGKGGRGLGKMKTLIDEFPDGRLILWSGGAKALIEPGGKMTIRRLAQPFYGTYVMWHLGQEPIT
ncbi:hypothetical protein [Brevundimonas sp.]|uniref:hypothetical protein n=1 Tax=Brevundimonas sp. TaxID=1871086 RepID=UPI001A3006B5|nr:hypothetical protein [Brevundimonas sp.]MBJ7484358.1 hypothetical protein [Brevundimonas sp.]